MLLIAQAEIGVQALMTMLGPLGIAGILVWYLWYNVTITQPKTVEENNKRMDSREAEYQKREEARDKLFRESFKEKDAMFCNTIETCNNTIRDYERQRKVETEQCQKNYETILAANAMLVAQGSVLTQMVVDNDQQSGQEKTILLIVEDSPICAHLAKRACENVIEEIADISYATVEVVNSLKKAIKKRREAFVMVLDVNLGAETNVLHAKAFVEACSVCPVIIWSGNKYDHKDFPRAYAVLNKEDHPAPQLQKVVMSAIKDFPGVS